MSQNETKAVEPTDSIDASASEICGGPDCNELVHPTEALSVAWANPLFCSRSCRDRWTNTQTGHGGVL